MIEQFDIPLQGDEFDDIREEYTEMLKKQAAKGNNGILKSKYLIFGTECSGYKEARAKLSSIEADVIKNFLNLGTHAKSLDGKERLRVLHEYFNQDTMEPFRFSFKELSESGKSVKDYIAPPGFDFRYPSRFKSGKMYGSVHYLDIIAPRFNDELLKKLLDIDDNLTITMHMQTYDPVKAIKMLKGALTNIQKMKIEEQKKAVRSGYDMDILPTDIVTYEKDTLELLDDLNTSNQKIIKMTFLITCYGRSKRALENITQRVSGIIQQANCNLRCLQYLQEQGLMASAPIGCNDTGIERVLTTKSTAILVPFCTQELFMPAPAIYYAKYQQGKSPEEMAAFLQKEYGTTGKGFEFDGKQVSVWFNEQGMTVGHGTSALENPKLTMSWQEIEQQIRTQVESGTYMGANEAYLVDEVERGRIADHLFFFFRDGMGEMPEELDAHTGGYPDTHAKMVGLLSSPEGIKQIASQMDKALAQLESGEKKLRFRSVMPKEELRAELDNLLVEKQEFPTPDVVEVRKEDFITQDEIDNRLGRGSSFSHGTFRIYDYFREGHSSEDAVKFLKNEYGIGGSTHALAGADHSYEDHDAKGIRLRKGNIMEPYNDVLISWKTVEKRIRKLIEEDKYLSPEGKEAYAQYKEEQAQKELEKAQAKIERDTKVSCKNAIERAIAEKFDGYRLPKDAAEGVIREYGIERVSYVLANTVMYKSQDGRFSPDNKEWAKAIEPYAMYENRDMVVDSHPAVLNGFINQTRRQEKELAEQAYMKNLRHTITINHFDCRKIDEWENDGNTFVLGNALDDRTFFYAEVNGSTSFEYDHEPDREGKEGAEQKGNHDSVAEAGSNKRGV